MAEDEGFLRRWARRKSAQQTPAEDGATAPLPEAEDAVPENAPPARVDALESEQAIDLDALPDIESLSADSDFSIFMQDGIPDALRTRALQKLWRLDPAFGHIDELLDYAEDFSGGTTAIAAVRTVYQVGKGMLGGGDEEAASATADVETPAVDEVARAELPPDADVAPDAAVDDVPRSDTTVRPEDPDRSV